MEAHLFIEMVTVIWLHNEYNALVIYLDLSIDMLMPTWNNSHKLLIYI